MKATTNATHGIVTHTTCSEPQLFSFIYSHNKQSVAELNISIVTMAYFYALVETVYYVD